ncbi:MAG: succinylglutamate desuccinylase/aspartoacylase family protein [Planctomycetota bacterium]
MNRTTSVLEPLSGAQRILGQIGSSASGPTLLVCCGIHGNEPAGVLAVRRVFEKLGRDDRDLHGRFIAVAGNLAALEERRRFVDRDLNRMWLESDVERLSRTKQPTCSEEQEMLELLAVIEQELEDDAGRVVFLDLHSTSANGPPFCCLGDTLPNRTIAMALGLPVILGLEETIDGGLLEYLNNRGCRTVGVEGGQHDDPHTVDRLEAAIWITLATAGLIDEKTEPAVAASRERLRRDTAGLPPVVEILHRHSITEADLFRMLPGFGSFQPIQAGEILARDRSGEIRSLLTGRVLLPLYQGQGNDGFFLGRDVRPFWLRLSRLLRRAHLQWLLRVMPGVQRHPTVEDALLVDPKIARFQVTNLFHLFGYRKCRPLGERLMFSRRR